MFSKVQNVTDILGTMEGHRAILFTVKTTSGKSLSVPFDFYGAGRNFNGATYARIESAMLGSVAAAGYNIETFTHHLLHLQ